MGEYKRYNNIPEKERNIIFNFINELKITGITEHGITIIYVTSKYYTILLSTSL